MDNTFAYLPMDRRLALVRGQKLPDRCQGAALFADISGFTELTEALVRECGPQRGAEELTRYLDLVYDAVIDELHRYGGSVIAFAGDAITCWLDGDDGRRATTCALAMQDAMHSVGTVATPAGRTVVLAMKAAVAVGAARRFLVGDPEIRVIDALAGATLERLANAEQQAQKGEVVVDEVTLRGLGDAVQVNEVRRDSETGQEIGVVQSVRQPVAVTPWPALDPGTLTEEEVRIWLLPPVYERLQSGLGDFLAELRPTVALFVRFGGIDYDHDDQAGAKLDAYMRWVQQVVAQYEGTLIDLNIGDKGCYLYINFGAPLAHEDNSQRAAAAALVLRSEPDHLCYIGQVQIGISQGQMRAGAYGGKSHRSYGVLGDEVNLAARLMMAAKPGQILMSLAAQRSIGKGFTVEELPPISVKGKSRPVSIFALLGTRQSRDFQLSLPTYSLPMVGRGAELADAAQKMAVVVQGQGQILGVTSEAGLGKSRLVAEIIRLAAERGFALYGGECESYGVNSGYLVWQPVWRGIFGVDAAWSVRQQIETIERRLVEIDPALLPRLPLLATLFNIDIPDNELTLSLDAKLRKTSLEGLLADCLRVEAQNAPSLIVLEACQWLDPLSSDLLETIGHAIADLPVLLVVAFRPLERERLRSVRVDGFPNYSEIQLPPLSAQDAAQFVELKLAQLLGPEIEVPPMLVERITAQADGNPFYMEELINYLQAQGIDFNNSAALAQVELPDSLQRLVLSLVDQLSESQKIAVKVASVIGRVFRATWLQGMYPDLGDPARVPADLEILRQQDLMLREPATQELVYLFRQMITQGVTYESLPHSVKSSLHEQIGQFIEQTYPNSLDQYLDLLAYHYDRSENQAKRRQYLLKAGDAAQATYANAAAIDFYRRVLPLLAEEEQAPVMLKQGQVLELVGQWDEADTMDREALTLATRLDDLPRQAQAQRALGGLLRKRGDYPEALGWMEQALSSFARLDDTAGVAYLLADIGEVYRLQGKYAEASSQYEESLRLAATMSPSDLHSAVRAYALKGAGTVAKWTGSTSVARAMYEESIAIRRDLGDKPGVAVLLNNLGIVARFERDLEGARRLNDEGLTLFRELGDRWSVGQLLNNQACVASDQGDYRQARVLLRDSLAIRRQLGDKAGLALSLNTLADVVLDEGDFAEVRPLLDESLRLNQELGNQTAIAYLLEDYAGLAAAEAQPERALRLAGCAAALRETIGAPLPLGEQTRVDRLLAPARRALTERAAAEAWAEGRGLLLHEAIKDALNGPPTASRDAQAGSTALA